MFTPSGMLNVADGLIAIDVNRFVGPGVPPSPRRLIYRQRFVYSSWQGAGTVTSRVFADGLHIRSLLGAPGAFTFGTEHRFGGVASTPAPYLGPNLIVLTAWTVLSGGVSFTAGNPSIPPAPATLTAGLRSGTARVRAADTRFPNRRGEGNVTVAPVVLRAMVATLSTVPAGTNTATVSGAAQPGGRVVNWTVDAAAAAAGVRVTPPTTGPAAPAMIVKVTRPSGFAGRVTVTATDSVLPARTTNVRIRFN